MHSFPVSRLDLGIAGKSGPGHGPHHEHRGNPGQCANTMPTQKPKFDLTNRLDPCVLANCVSPSIGNS
jgi:hypothetical protein